MTSRGCALCKEAIQDQWLIDYSTVSAFGALAIVTKSQAVQLGTTEQSIRRADNQARVWIHMHSLHHRIRESYSNRTARRSAYAISKKILLYSVTCYLSQKKILMLISLFDHILKQLIDMLLLPIICTHLNIIYNLTKYHLCQMIYENHETALLLNLFPKWKVIWVKLCIL